MNRKIGDRKKVLAVFPFSFFCDFQYKYGSGPMEPNLPLGKFQQLNSKTIRNKPLTLSWTMLAFVAFLCLKNTQGNFLLMIFKKRKKNKKKKRLARSGDTHL